MAHATAAQLAAWLDVDENELPDDADRLLDRASEVVDDAVIAPYDADDTDTMEVLQIATCAQVEFWMEVGEEHDVTGQRGSVAIQGLNIGKLPATLAPRARRALVHGGLGSLAVQAY